jgi:proteasome accessory factor A
MTHLFGIETEYGIAVEGRGAGDLMQESIALVRSYAGPHVTGWNYRGEDPRRDMRGFTVDHLSTNPDDAQFDEPGRPPMSIAEERSDHILANGARFYNDHGHPEYCTPECSNLRDLVAHDRAGERIVWECAQRRAQALGAPVYIYKNNTDFHGASYGTHEGYLMRRDVPPNTLIQALLPFFVTRQIYAGAGKVGVEVDRVPNTIYQLSQRADFFTVEASVDTLHNRPIVNTRDEPHATPRLYRRLHVIVGDANMSEWATATKVGAAALVIRLLEEGWTPAIKLRNPVGAIKEVSRDQTLRWLVTLDDGRTISAIDVQRHYLQEAQRRLAGSSPDADWVLVEWAGVLDALERDILLAADRVDWIAKRRLLDQFMQEEGIDWENPILQSLDLAYHDLDPESSLFLGLEQQGQIRRLVTEKRIEAAMTCPPQDTRAFLRGFFVHRFGSAVRAVGWNGVAFRHNGDDLLFDMNPLVDGRVGALNEELGALNTLDEVVAAIRREPGEVETSEWL